MDSGPGSSVEVGTVSLKEPDPTSSRVTFGGGVGIGVSIGLGGGVVPHLLLGGR